MDNGVRRSPLDSIADTHAESHATLASDSGLRHSHNGRMHVLRSIAIHRRFYFRPSTTGTNGTSMTLRDIVKLKRNRNASAGVSPGNLKIRR